MHSANRTRRLTLTFAGLSGLALLAFAGPLSPPAPPAGATGLTTLERAGGLQQIRPVEWVELMSRLRQQHRTEDLFRTLAYLESEHPDLIAANDLYAMAGDAAREAGDPERAQSLYHKALAQDSPIAGAVAVRLGEVLGELGRPTDAQDCLRPLLGPGQPTRVRRDALRVLAAAWRKAGDVRRVEAIDRAILGDRAMRSEHADARLDLARLELQQHRPAEAAAELAKLMRSRRSTLGKVDAVLLMRQIEAEHPGLGGSVRGGDRLERGRILYESGHFAEGVQELEAAVRAADSGPIASEARYLLGRVEYRRERDEPARHVIATPSSTSRSAASGSAA